MRYVSEFITLSRITWRGPSAKWYPIYVKFEPWIPRLVLLLLAAGLIEMFYGYASDGAYGITRGLEKAAAGAVIAAVWIIAKGMYA